MSRNRTFKHGAQQWEIFWTSELAEHVARTHQEEPATHPLLHLDIARLLAGHRYFDAVLPRSGRRYFVLYDAANERIFRAVVTLAADPQGGPIGRAIVHTCVQVNQLAYRTLIDETLRRRKNR